jgi:hypothetical protein
MKSCLLLLLTAFAFTGYAQNEIYLFQSLPKNFVKPEIAKDSMPNALSGIVFHQKKTGNNHLGSDVYAAEPDHMTVLRPDSNFYSAMPNVYEVNNRKNALLKQLEQYRDSVTLMEQNKPYRFKLLKPTPKNKWLYQEPNAR